MSEHHLPLILPKIDESIDLCIFIETHLYTAVISDSLDELGLRHQAMREHLRPVWPGCRFAGWARTILCSDQYHIPEKPYEIEIDAIDSILPGEAVIVATQQSTRNAPWGELLSTAARARQARGAVIDGLIRDIDKIKELGFPVFAAGMKPVDSKGRGIVTDYNVPVECGQVLVNPNDLVVADSDGVVVIPGGAVEQTLQLAVIKVSRENDTREELLKGKLLRDVYNKYGVL